MATGRKPSAERHRARGEVRIIGGRWRGRRLPVADAPGLRPTADRIRETLFNWLQPNLVGARCLDLFAGSGALGIEALSRGAAHCTFVDSNTDVLRSISAVLAQLNASEWAVCHAQTAATFIAGSPAPFDVVFLDPPFAQELLPDICQQLQANGVLDASSLIYIESGHCAEPYIPGDAWQALRQKRAGAVHYGLFSCAPER